MQFSNFLAAALIAFSGLATAMKTANADVADISTNKGLADPPRGYGNDQNDHRGDGSYNNQRGSDNRGGSEADDRFCDKYTHGRKDKCRREFRDCDRQYNGRRKREYQGEVESKFESHNKSH